MIGYGFLPVIARTVGRNNTEHVPARRKVGDVDPAVWTVGVKVGPIPCLSIPCGRNKCRKE